MKGAGGTVRGPAREQSAVDAALEALLALFRQSGAATSDGAAADALLAPARLPVNDWLASVLPRAAARTRAACDALARAAPLLCWRQNATYRDPEFLARYGYCELAGPRGHRRDTRKSVGVLLLAPRTLYPPHRHPAEEVYVVLAGSAQWRIADAPWRLATAGESIAHPSLTVHAMRTDESPLLAAYLWTDHLDTPATLVRRT